MLTSTIDKLKDSGTLSKDELCHILTNFDRKTLDYTNRQAREVSQKTFGNKIYIRGLIELTNYCQNDCYYCGIRHSNPVVERYRLTKESILECCREGYKLGFRTFVMQGGEDPYFSDDCIADIVSCIREEFPNCAITLSLGEKSEKAYRLFFKSGANRYLLRHETYNRLHYKQLHPKAMSFDNRIKCLNILKNIGYQTGTGIMVGVPFQTIDNLVDDIKFIENLRPEMIGIGPFLASKDTPFAKKNNGSLDMTLMLLSIFRLMHPKALIPSTTALATLSPEGRQRGIMAGANVVMPNLSPTEQRRKYSLYNNKAALGAESAEGLLSLKNLLKEIGYEISLEIGDFQR